MKKYQYLLGLCIAALLMPVLSSCEDDSLFFRTGSMSKLAFTVSTADDNGGSASTRGVVHVFDSFVDEEGDTLYLACKIVDMDQPAAADSPATRGKYITGANLASVFGEFNVSAYREGKISCPLKETDEDGNQLTNAQSYVGITFSARSDGSGGQQTDDNDIPVWEATSSSLDNYYWPKNESLTFYAYAPTENVEEGPSWAGLTPADNYKDNGVIEFDYTVPVSSSTPRKDAEAQPDILVSSVDKKRSELSEYEEDTDTKYAIVPLKFYHALCAVEFHANRNADELLKEDVTVTSVSLGNLKGSGTCTFTPSSTGSKSADFISWDFTDVTDNEGNYSQAFNYKNVTPASHIDQPLDASTDPATAFMLIPQKVGGGSSATDSDAPDASVTLGYTSTSGTAKTKTISLHGSEAYEWKAGKKYIYHLTGSLASLTLDGSLLTWGMADAPLGLRHYVLSVTGPGGSDPEITFNDPLNKQDRGFELASYYYEGEDDSEVNNRTPVIFTMEYQDGTGEWHSFTPEYAVQPSSSSGEPYLSSTYGYLNASSGDFQDLHYGLSSFMDDSQPIAAIRPLRESKKYMLTANRALTASSVPLLQDCVDKDPHLWDDEIYGYNTANNANNWDLSRMDIGCELPEGGYSATAVRNSANCYIVRRPGTYKFPVVYGNGLQGGSATAAGGYASTIPAGQEIVNMKNFINALGEEIFTVTNDHGTNVVKDKDLGDVWILTDMNGKQTAGLNDKGQLKNDIKITDRAKAALLWCDAQETVSGTTQQLISNVTLTKKDKDDYISFTTADNKHLVEGNAVIVLYYDYDNSGTYTPDDGDFALWSWHIWVTDAHFAPSNLAELTVSPGTITGSSYTYAGTYHFMTRDLGECDNPSKLYTMKADWRKELLIRFKQVEGDAGYQYLTVKMPDMERPTAPNAVYYQWGRKDPFPGKTNADANSSDPKPYYYLGSATATTTVSTYADPGTMGGTSAVEKDESIESITASIKFPSHFLSDNVGNRGRKLLNLWNLVVLLSAGNDIDAKSDACVYTAVQKTLYDPCPYGYVVPNMKALFALVGGVTRTNAFTYVFVDPILKPNTFWYGCVYDDASLIQEKNLIFPAYGGRTRETGAVGYVTMNYRYSSSNPSNCFYVGLPKTSPTATSYTGTQDYAFPIRPIRESDY